MLPIPPAEGVHTHPTRKKGLRPATPARPAALFRAGLRSGALPEFPDSWPIPDGAPWPMDGNDVAGDCVVAGLDHYLQTVAEYLGVPRANWTAEQIVTFYRTQNPDYDPAGSRSTNGPGSAADGGMNIQAFLGHLVKVGEIVAFGRVDATHPEELKAASYIGLGSILGVQVQQAQMSAQFDAGVWDWAKGSPNDGGHCVPIVGWPVVGGTPMAECITWAKPVALTGAFLAHQCGEAWFVLTNAMIAHPGFRNAYDLAGFAAAVHEVTRGKVVVPVPPQPAPVSPTPSPGPGAASFPVSADLVDHIAAASHRARLTPAAWLDHRLRSYFRLPPGTPQ